MKKLDFYDDYICYLNWRLEKNEITLGKYSLLKISKSEYDRFMKKLENNETFNKKVIEIVRAEIRNRKLKQIIASSEKLDDFFDGLDD